MQRKQPPAPSVANPQGMTEEEKARLVRALREEAKTCRGMALLQKNRIGALRFEMKAKMAADFATVLEEIDCKKLTVPPSLARRLRKGG